MFQLHIANKNYSSWSLRAWILMKQLNIPFNENLHPFCGVATKQEFQHFSPSATVPCLVDEDIKVWDSLAIAEYLAESAPEVWPKDKAARAFARSAAAEMHSSFFHLRNQCSMSCGVRIELRAIDAGLKTDLERLEVLWQQGFDAFGGPFLAGNQFSAVDAFFCPVAFRVQTYGLCLGDRAMQYIKHLLALPSMLQWYEQALQETMRDADHDTSVLSFGKLLDDFRETDELGRSIDEIL